MIKNLLLSILIFFVIYILLIFKAPEIAGMIENTLGINGFNNFVLSFKSTYDETITKIPTQEELQKAYDSVYGSAYSGAIEIKGKIDDGLNVTKDKVDSLRITLSGAEDTINNLKDGYDKTKDFIDTNSGVINDIQSAINTVSEITNTGTTN